MTQSMDRSERILVKYPLFKTAIARIQECFDSHDATAEPDCCPLVGESGSGKTTIISYFASHHPRVDHKWGIEVPVLVAKVPARPTVKSFAETLLYQLGDPLCPAATLSARAFACGSSWSAVAYASWPSMNSSILLMFSGPALSTTLLIG